MTAKAQTMREIVKATAQLKKAIRAASKDIAENSRCSPKAKALLGRARLLLDFSRPIDGDWSADLIKIRREEGIRYALQASEKARQV